jgi:hypothetical protein
MTLGRNRKPALIITAFLLLLFSIYALFRWTHEFVAFDHAKQISDTRAYLRIAGEPFLSLQFLADNRPPAFPFVLKVFGGDFFRIAVFQTVFSIIAWGLLALAVANSFHIILRPVAFSLILALSLVRHISGWDVVILTESLSLSLLALFIAAWFWLLSGWSWHKVCLVNLIAFMWVFTRDTNGWLMLMIVGAITLAVLFFGASKRFIWISGVFVILFGLGTLNADIGNRWIYPFQNVLAQRILPDEDAVEFFAACGMPVTPELMRLSGGFANSKSRAFYTDPALDSYRKWLHTDGKVCYMRWLLASPMNSIAQPMPDFEALIAFPDVGRFFPQQYKPQLPWYLEGLLFPKGAILILWILNTIAVLIALVGKAWKFNVAWVIVIVSCILVYPHLFIVWHGDTVGTDRHALMASVQFVLGLWLTLLLIAERIILRLHEMYLKHHVTQPTW